MQSVPNLFGAHLRAGGVRCAPGPLAPRSTLAAQLLSAMLSYSLQQQVVDGGEMIVAAALQRLVRTEQIHEFALFTIPSLLHSVPLSVLFLFCFFRKSSLTECQNKVFRHLNCLLAVDPQGVHDAEHRLAVVAQVGVVLCQGMSEDLACSCRVCQHPPVLFDLGHCDPPGRVHHQHFTDQIFTVWWKLGKE